MIKARKRWLSVLLTVAMLAALLIPLATPAQAACSYTVVPVLSLQAGKTYNLTTSPVYLQISMDKATALAATGSQVDLSLPSDPSGFALSVNTNGIQVVGGTVAVSVYKTGTQTPLASTDQVRSFTLAVNSVGTISDSTVIISVPITYLAIPGGASGSINLTATPAYGSVFSGGSVTIATVGSKQVTLAAESVPSISSSGGQIGVIDISENMAGALKDSGSDAALKLTLPPGFSWDTTAAPTVSLVFGNLNVTSPQINPTTPPNNTLYFTTANNGRELQIHVPDAAASTGSGASFLKVTASITVDESVAKTGDVKVTVSGAATATPSELVVAKYGEYGLTVKAISAPDLVAGKAVKKIGKFEIAENLKGSLIPDRTITLTLPDGVKWAAMPKIDEAASTTAGIDVNAVNNSWQPVGSDGRMIKGTIKFQSGLTSTTDAAKLVFKDAKVTISPEFSGNLDVTIGGSQGLTGTITLGKVAAGVKVSVSSTPDVKIGLSDQVAGDVTIAETAAGIIDSTVTYSTYNGAYPNSGMLDKVETNNQAQIVLVLPSGVKFSSLPTVSVTQGDLQIDTPKTQNDDTELVIPIKSSSTTPSTIKITNIKLTVNRTVPEGPVNLKVEGTAVNQTLDKDGKDTYFPGATAVAKVAIAKCVTPAPHEVVSKAIFKINEAKYTIDGKEYPMDAAPYIDPVTNRAMAPMRYIAYAAGVTPENILWNPETRTATFMKGDRIVQVTADSNILVVNGTNVAMDVKAVIKDGRFFLPVRWLSVALGCQVDWNAQTQEVIVLRNVVQTPGQTQ
ncbi:stalk domain-containing protein [Desulfothermobacter acidiphilus]|uniref:stalk domain-containing protein n=1 Tax=Desulfothermobacter acidiphilus TaxID=1938353 RepID=UPI003F890A42